MKHLDEARVLADVLDDHGFAPEHLLDCPNRVWALAVTVAELRTHRKLEQPTDATKSLVHARLTERARLEATHPLDGIGMRG